MKAARIQNSILDLSKGIADCEKQLSQVIKVKENENNRAKANSQMSRGSVRNKNASHAVSVRKTASKPPDKPSHPSRNMTTPRVRTSPSRGSGSNDKTIIHKEVIGDGMGQTCVKIVVQNKPYKKQSHRSEDALLKARSVSEDPSKRRPMSGFKASVDNPRTSKPNQSWANILQRNSTLPETIRSSDSVRHRSKSKERNGRPRVLEYLSSDDEYGNVAVATPQEKLSSHVKSPSKMSGNVKKQDETDGYFSVFNPKRTLNFLIKELRGTIHKGCEENVQRIVEDMEKAVNEIPAGDTTSTPSNQLTLQPPTSSGRGATCKRKSSLANASVNMSSNASGVENARMSDPKSSVTVPGAAQLVGNLFSTVAHLSQLTKSSGNRTTIGEQNPQSQPQSSSIFPIDPTTALLQSQLEHGCKQLEDTCKQMEETCDNLRHQRDQLNEELRNKTKQLESVLNKNQQLTAYAADLRQELMRVQQSAEALNREHDKNLLSIKNQLKECKEKESKQSSCLEEIRRENEKLKMEMQLSCLEKDKLHALISNKDLEVAKLKKEIIDIHALVAEQLASLRVVSDQNFILNKLDEMLQTSGQFHDLATDDNLSVTLTELNEHEHKKNFSRVPHNGGGEGPVCSSPTSSTNSSLHSSWQILSDITAADANLLFECPKKAGTSSSCDGKLEEKTKGKKESCMTSLPPVEIIVPEKSNPAPQNEHTTSKERNYYPKRLKTTTESLKAGLQDMFQELKKKTAEAVNISLPSPPKEFSAMPEPLGISQWSELSASESVRFHTSDDSLSDVVK